MARSCTCNAANQAIRLSVERLGSRSCGPRRLSNLPRKLAPLHFDRSLGKSRCRQQLCSSRAPQSNLRPNAQVVLSYVDIEQAVVQSDLEENVFMRLPQGCGRLSGKIVRPNKSLYGLKQASRQWHAHLTRCLLTLGFLQRLADACVFRLMEDEREVMTVVVHVDDIFAVGEKTRCDQFVRDMNKMVPVKNLGELGWYSGCFYERDWEKRMLIISQQTFAEQLASEYGVEYGKSVPLPVGAKRAKFDINEAPGGWPFRALVGSLMMWLATQTRPDNSNAVRAVARYCSAPKYVHWRAAILGILGHVRRTSGFGIAFQRGSVRGLSLQAFADADCASVAADREVSFGGTSNVRGCLCIMVF